MALVSIMATVQGSDIGGSERILDHHPFFSKTTIIRSAI